MFRQPSNFYVFMRAALKNVRLSYLSANVPPLLTQRFLAHVGRGCYVLTSALGWMLGRSRYYPQFAHMGVVGYTVGAATPSSFNSFLFICYHGEGGRDRVMLGFED